MDRRLGRRLGLQSFRERMSIVFIGRTDEQVSPPPHDVLKPLQFELLGERNGVAMRGKFDPHLPFGKTGRLRFGRLLLLKPFVFGSLSRCS